MVLTDTTLFVAGPPDFGSEGADAPAAFGAKLGALLRVVSAENGNKLAEYDIGSPPVFDGMAAANGRLYLATNDGRVLCFGGKK